MADKHDGIEIAIRIGNIARLLLQAFGMTDPGLIRIVLNEVGKELMELDKRLDEMKTHG